MKNKVLKISVKKMIICCTYLEYTSNTNEVKN